MKLTRILFLMALAIAVASIVLLLNFTAANPTHRRYSSIPALTTGEGSGAEIGRSGEDILAKDLDLPRNDSSNQRQCICSASNPDTPTECRSCFVQLPDISSNSSRRPDFVSSAFIAEVKNRRDLRYPGEDFQQIRDYANAAKKLDIPLWLFVRIDTEVDPEFYEVVHSTGGDIVFYLAPLDYDDPVDQSSRVALIISGIVCIFTISQEISIFQVKRLKRVDKVSEAEKIADNIEDFLQAAKDRAKARLEPYDE